MGLREQAHALLKQLRAEQGTRLRVTGGGLAGEIEVQGRPRAGTREEIEAVLGGNVWDTTGQTRDVYGPLVASHLQLAHGREAVMAFAAGVAKASAAMRAWAGVLLEMIGERAMARRVVDGVLAEQTPAGHFHPLTVDTSLDAFVFDEFAAMHALDRLERMTRDPRLVAAMQKATAYHIESTQPDNTSQQPWGVAAFARFPETMVMAEQLVHDAMLYCQTHAGTHPVTVMLLWDAVGSLPGDG